MSTPGVVFIAWIACIVLSVAIARNKNRSRLGWFFLSLYLGPIALIIIISLSKREKNPAVTPSGQPLSSLGALKAELEALKNEFSILSNRLNRLAAKIDMLEPEAPVIEQAPVPIVEKIEEPQPVPVVKVKEPFIRKPDIEMNLGKFWLNKIGIIVFSLGVAFLLSYTVTRFGAAAKILFGYLVAVALFIAGLKLEKIEKFINYGRVLLGGSWAITYFTTYSMYHFQASKIINNQLLELFLLALVASGIIIHSLRYKSQSLTAITLFIGYFTSVLGDVSYFTLLSTSVLAVTALVLVYKMQWVRFIFLGVILTYLTHLVWVVKQISFSLVPVGHLNVENVYFLFDIGFLAIYWALFNLAIHLLKDNVTSALSKKLAAINFANFLLFFLMAYPKLYLFYPEQKFNAVLGLSLAYLIFATLMDNLKKKELFISDIIIGVSLLTLAIPLKFLPYYTMVIWFVELPFLLFVGFNFKQKVYRYLGFALSAVIFFRFGTGDWPAFIAFAGFISTAGCFSLYRFLKVKDLVSDKEKMLQNFYSGFSVVYLTAYVWDMIKPPWLTLGLSLESLLIFIIGVVILDRYIRCYALVILGVAAMRFCFYDSYNDVNELRQLFFVYGPIACVLAEYFIYRKLNKKSLISGYEAGLSKFLFIAASSLLIFAVVIYVRQILVSLSIFIVALLALLWGIKIADKHIRLYALLVLLFAAIRFMFFDTYYSVDRIIQWLFIGSKIACAYAAYFIYRAENEKSALSSFEKVLITPLFYLSSALLVLTIFKYINDTWVSLALGLAGVALFVAGFLIKDKLFRHAGFIVFGITLARVIFIDLSGLAIIYKIISFIVLGILFLGVSFIYTKYTAEKINQK